MTPPPPLEIQVHPEGITCVVLDTGQMSARGLYFLILPISLSIAALVASVAMQVPMPWILIPAGVLVAVLIGTFLLLRMFLQPTIRVCPVQVTPTHLGIRRHKYQWTQISDCDVNLEHDGPVMTLRIDGELAKVSANHHTIGEIHWLSHQVRTMQAAMTQEGANPEELIEKLHTSAKKKQEG